MYSATLSIFNQVKKQIGFQIPRLESFQLLPYIYILEPKPGLTVTTIFSIKMSALKYCTWYGTLEIAVGEQVEAV